MSDPGERAALPAAALRDRQVAYDAMLAVKQANEIDDTDYALADAIFSALSPAPTPVEPSEESE